MIAAGWGALITLLLDLAPDNRSARHAVLADRRPQRQRDAVDRADRRSWSLLAGIDAGGAATERAVARRCAPRQALGVAVVPLRLRVYLAASLAAAAAVTTAGTIGFVGLVVPHVLRLAFGNDQRMLLPAAALGGGRRGDGRGL